MSSGLGREDDDDEGYDGPLDPVEHVLHSPGGSDSSPEVEEAFIRQMQFVRGSISTKMIASKRTLGSLESVKLEELPEADRSCVICYNEYGVETPEGINEAPLRLPKCGHVFGDHCIKKWFEDSDSCPYCRDKLHSEPKTQPGASARAFMNMMRARSANLQSGLGGGPNAEEAISRAYLATYGPSDRNAPPIRQSAPAGRRSPPREGNERQQRRLRPRHNNSNTRDTLPLPENRNHAVSFEAPPQPVAVSLGLSSMQSEQIPTERQYDWRMDSAQTVNNVTTTPQERSEESTRQNERLPPMLPHYPTQDLPNRDPRIRTFRNPLQMPNGAPLVGPGNDETPPPVNFQQNRNRPW
ncbi:hypothetical protein NW762_000773 [Fusarium torreyae]|uniref:RING-type domain-containing protein n=1 Tax=Fusarium torreyae TaxID=1237075 RepID=A0A9W8SIF8_9HYPO|nr:hypothetical protein NW762_000773 [Fusarium torreyae]